jgi:dihydroorotase
VTGSLLIEGAQVVSSQGTRIQDVFVDGQRIQVLGDPGTLQVRADRTLDARGLYLLPGVIDAHVHFRQPGYEWKEDLASGSRAAAAGGVTTFFDMPNTSPPTVHLSDLRDKKELAAKHSWVNYNFFLGATPHNLPVLSEPMNIPGIKVFMGSSTGDLLIDDPQVLRQIFMVSAHLIAVHAEDEATLVANQKQLKLTGTMEDHLRIRTPEAALKASSLAAEMAIHFKKRLHILHLTTAQEVAWLKQLKSPWITSEVCPHHVFLSAPKGVARLNTLAKVNPPIRSEEHQMALWAALKSGTIQTMASDHAPHTRAEKERPYPEAPSGMPGVETMLPLMLQQVHQNEISLNQVVGWLCEKPAEIFRVQGRGKIQEGYQADLVLVDMETEWVIQGTQLQSKAGWTAFEGWKVKGRPVMTFVNGTCVYRNGTMVSMPAGQEARIGGPS